MREFCPLRGNVVITFALVVKPVADVLAVSLSMSPGTVAVINEKVPDGRIIAGMLVVASNAAQAGNVVVKVVGAHEDCGGRSQGECRGRKEIKKWCKSHRSWKRCKDFLAHREKETQ